MSMSIWQKIIIGIVATIVWCGAIWVHHTYVDIDVSALILTAQSVIGGLGLTHVIGSVQSGVDAKKAQAAPDAAPVLPTSTTL